MYTVYAHISNLNYKDILTLKKIGLRAFQGAEPPFQAFNESCPMETIKVKYGNRHEWINNDLKAEIKDIALQF